MASYSFVTLWEIPAPLEKVWEAFLDFDGWPAWWKGLEKLTLLRRSTGPCGVGSVRRYTWKSRLPYRLTSEMQVSRVEPLVRIELCAAGELEGTGCWRFSAKGRAAQIRYDWNVRTNKAWMNVLAPVARPLFEWNHDVLMRWGEGGLKRHLLGIGRSA